MIHYGSNEAAANETRNACAAAGGASARIEIVARLIHSLFLTPDAVVDLSTRPQLMAFARKYVVPIVTG